VKKEERKVYKEGSKEGRKEGVQGRKKGRHTSKGYEEERNGGGYGRFMCKEGKQEGKK